MSAGALARKLPVKGVLAAPHESVRFEIDGATASDFYFAYRGTPDDLLRCGVVTAAALQHRSRNDRDLALDADGEEIRVKRRQGRPWVEVRRWKSRNLESMPGFEPWMREAAPRMNEASPSPPRHEAASCGRELSPEEWRAHMIGRLTAGIGFTVQALGDQPDPDDVHLQEGWEPVASDVEALKRRAEAVLEELVSMIERMRIASTVSARSGLRLVVDNTRRLDGGLP